MEIKYRTESFSGTEVRAVRDVICYEERYPVPLDPKQWFNDFLKKGE